MDTSKGWVALLDADEDDHLFWQYGFQSWAAHLDLQAFHSIHAYLAASGLGRQKPVAVLLDGLIPQGEEARWLSTLLLHPSSQGASLIMISAQLDSQAHELYLQLGAADHLLKPVNLEELKVSVLRISDRVASRHSATDH